MYDDVDDGGAAIEELPDISQQIPELSKTLESQMLTTPVVARPLDMAAPKTSNSKTKQQETTPKLPKCKAIEPMSKHTPKNPRDIIIVEKTKVPRSNFSFKKRDNAPNLVKKCIEKKVSVHLDSKFKKPVITPVSRLSLKNKKTSVESCSKKPRFCTNLLPDYDISDDDD